MRLNNWHNENIYPAVLEYIVVMLTLTSFVFVHSRSGKSEEACITHFRDLSANIRLRLWPKHPCSSQLLIQNLSLTSIASAQIRFLYNYFYYHYYYYQVHMQVILMFYLLLFVCDRGMSVCEFVRNISKKLLVGFT